MQGALQQFNFRHDRYWVWVAFGVGIGWIIMLNLIIMIALRFFNSEFPRNQLWQPEQIFIMAGS